METETNILYSIFLPIVTESYPLLYYVTGWTWVMEMKLFQVNEAESELITLVTMKPVMSPPFDLKKHSSH